MSRFERSSGVLLPVASLPSGTLGDDALRFVDWLADAGQQWWQILPFGPPDEWGSPYASASAFAGSPTWLARPEARVSVDEIEELVAAHPFWTGSWAAFAGPGALADQVRFTREWERVRRHAAERGVRVLGDMSFYVAAGSCDHQALPELFRTGFVGGVPPDDWSADGQRWGTPVYDWAAHRAQGYRWWKERFARTFELVDAVRIDHFRGFVAAWLVPEQERTARRGRWVRGPGRQVFDAVRDAHGELTVVAENLGMITRPVEDLRRAFDMPGSVVLQFAFSDDLLNPQPDVGPDAVVYTGTHDNDTTMGWWGRASAGERAAVREAARQWESSDPEPNWMLIRLALDADAVVSMIPAQDVLGLGNEARINRPGRRTGNWRWRLPDGALDRHLARRLRAATEDAKRTR